MKAYSPSTNKGRTVAIDDVHHKTADQSKKESLAASKSLKHSVRQWANKEIKKELA
jgi:hypothetical protein